MSSPELPADDVAAKLLATTDAVVWAEEFMKIVRAKWNGTNLPINEGFMIGWFANAIETGRTHSDGPGPISEDGAP